MADVYVRKSGSDSNGGTSKTDAFLTLAHANTNSANNDRIVIGSGTYREVVTLSHTGQTWLGDVDGVLTGDAGDVIWTAFTTNDKTAPSSSMLVNLNGKNGHAFTAILFVGGTTATASCVGSATAVTGPTFTRCDFVSNGQTNVVNIQSAGAGANLTFDRCSLVGGINGFDLIFNNLPANASADYDCGAQYLNCMMLLPTTAGNAACVAHNQSGGTGSFHGGGGLVSGCTMIGGNHGTLVATASSGSGVYPLKVLGNYILGAAHGVFCNNHRGDIVEDWNAIDCVIPRTDVPTGPNSVGSQTYAPLFETWHAFSTGRALRPFGQPMASSPLLGFLPAGTKVACGIPGTLANDASVGTVAWSNPTNAGGPDNSTYATCAITASATGEYLKATNLGFALPSTATVTRVFARIVGHQSGGTFAQNSIRLVNAAGTIAGTDNSASGPVLTGSDGVFEVGGAADLWGLTLAYTDVNDVDFGVVIGFKNTNVSTTCTVSIDYLAVFVEYTDSALPTEQTQDITNGPRPAGGQTSLAAGAFERGNTAAKETGTVQAGSTSGKLLGPSYQDFNLAVDATSTTVAVYLRYDGVYAGSTLPSLSVLNGTECGVSDASVSQVGADNTWEQVNLTFTPSQKGFVTVRVSNLSTAASGAAYFDSFSVA